MLAGLSARPTSVPGYYNWPKSGDNCEYTRITLVQVLFRHAGTVLTSVMAPEWTFWRSYSPNCRRWRWCSRPVVASTDVGRALSPANIRACEYTRITLVNWPKSGDNCEYAHHAGQVLFRHAGTVLTSVMAPEWTFWRSYSPNCRRWRWCSRPVVASTDVGRALSPANIRA